MSGLGKKASEVSLRCRIRFWVGGRLEGEGGEGRGKIARPPPMAKFSREGKSKMVVVTVLRTKIAAASVAGR